MYELMVEGTFAAAHQLRGYEGSCESMHGHNWRVQIAVRTGRLDEIGIAIDFTELKKVLNTYIDTLDHTNLNQLPFFTQDNPSSENVARWIYEQLSEDARLCEVEVMKVIVWESDRVCATYYQEKKT